jgi:hypothetical protein
MKRVTKEGKIERKFDATIIKLEELLLEHHKTNPLLTDNILPILQQTDALRKNLVLLLGRGGTLEQQNDIKSLHDQLNKAILSIQALYDKVHNGLKEAIQNDIRTPLIKDNVSSSGSVIISWSQEYLDAFKGLLQIYKEHTGNTIDENQEKKVWGAQFEVSFDQNDVPPKLPDAVGRNFIFFCEEFGTSKGLLSMKISIKRSTSRHIGIIRSRINDVVFGGIIEDSGNISPSSSWQTKVPGAGKGTPKDAFGYFIMSLLEEYRS